MLVRKPPRPGRWWGEAGGELVCQETEDRKRSVVQIVPNLLITKERLRSASEILHCVENWNDVTSLGTRPSLTPGSAQ